MSRITDDPRIDPRIKALMGAMPDMTMGDVVDRVQLLDEVNQPEALVQAKQMDAMLDLIDDETIAPSAGLDISTLEFVSEPDTNTVKIQFIRPEVGHPAALRLLHPRWRHGPCPASTACTAPGAG